MTHTSFRLLASYCAAALFAGLATNPAHAKLTPIDNTPANDMLDSATGLIWLRTSTLDEGLAAGFRLATAAEAAMLPLASATEQQIFQLGYSSGAPLSITQPEQGALHVAALGHVAGPQGEKWLAGFFLRSFYDTGFGPPEYKGFFLTGDPELFKNIVIQTDAGTTNPADFLWQHRSNVLIDGQLTQVCDAYCHYRGPNYIDSWGLWAFGLSKGQQSGFSYYMVRSSVPEASTAAMLGLGLMGMAGAARLRDRTRTRG